MGKGLTFSFFGIALIVSGAIDMPKKSFYFAPPVIVKKSKPPPPIEQWLKDRNQTSYEGVSEKTRGEIDTIKAAGDNYFMRHPGHLTRYIKNRPEIVRKFQFSRMSNNYEEMEKKLKEIIKADNIPTILKYRACIGLSRASIRAYHYDNTTLFAENGINLYKDTVEQPPWLSDAYYLLSQVDEHNYAYFQALHRLNITLRLDDSFLEAHWAAVRTAGFLLGSQNQRLERRKKLHLLDRLLKSLVSITELTENRKDYLELAKNLSEQSRSSYVDFASAFCYFHVGDFTQASKYFTRIQEQPTFNETLELISNKSQYYLEHIKKIEFQKKDSENIQNEEK